MPAERLTLAPRDQPLHARQYLPLLRTEVLPHVLLEVTHEVDEFRILELRHPYGRDLHLHALVLAPRIVDHAAELGIPDGMHGRIEDLLLEPTMEVQSPAHLSRRRTTLARSASGDALHELRDATLSLEACEQLLQPAVLLPDDRDDVHERISCSFDEGEARGRQSHIPLPGSFMFQVRPAGGPVRTTLTGCAPLALFTQ